jgi:hypothetical protein
MHRRIDLGIEAEAKKTSRGNKQSNPGDMNSKRSAAKTRFETSDKKQ